MRIRCRGAVRRLWQNPAQCLIARLLEPVLVSCRLCFPSLIPLGWQGQCIGQLALWRYGTFCRRLRRLPRRACQRGRFVLGAARNPAVAYPIPRARSGGRPVRNTFPAPHCVKFCSERAKLEAFASRNLRSEPWACAVCLREITAGPQPPAAGADAARPSRVKAGAARAARSE